MVIQSAPSLARGEIYEMVPLSFLKKTEGFK